MLLHYNKMKIRRNKLTTILLFLITCTFYKGYGQQLLQKKISINITNKTTEFILDVLEKEGGFYFSYNSNIIQGDKIHSINAQHKTIEHILIQLLGTAYKYEEKDGYIIIKSDIHQSITVIGKLIDAENNEPVAYASVYDKSMRFGAMSDELGNFKLTIKQTNTVPEIIISKVSFADTQIVINKHYNSTQPIPLRQVFYNLDSVTITNVSDHWLARRVLSSKQRLNSINLNNYFSTQPYQFSFTPGLGTKNRMNSQYVNKFSFNILGGYTAGLNGVEIGGLFNMIQRDMRYVQIAGIYNIVGGEVNGVQIGGLYNYVGSNTKGVQIGGLFNTNKGNVQGIQIGGIYNYVKQMNGIQIAGVSNLTKDEARGIQIAGIMNRSDNYNGIKVSGLVNYSKKIKGLQIGVVNIADTIYGYSIGFINVAKNGKNSFSISTSEMQHLQLNYKSGTERLYSIIQGGTQLTSNELLFTFGYGMGTSVKLSENIKLDNELIPLYVYSGKWQQQNIVFRLQSLAKYELMPKAKLFFGPAINFHYYKDNTKQLGYKSIFESGYAPMDINKRLRFTIGFTAGVEIF